MYLLPPPPGNAVYKQNTEMCKLLLARGADVNFAGKSGRIPLYLAAKTGNAGIVRMMLKAEANIELKHVTGL